MKKYFTNNGAQQMGPYTIEELKHFKISPDTPVWYEGLGDWSKAGQVEELKILFTTSVPPSFQQSTTPQGGPAASRTVPPYTVPPKKSRAGLIVGLVALVLVIGIALVIIANNPNAIPGMKLEVNTPKPMVVSSRADGAKSGLLKQRTTVYATILNQGGAGNVLVTFHVYQDGNDFDRSKSIYMSPNENIDLDMTFDEVRMLGGKITYNAEAVAQ